MKKIHDLKHKLPARNCAAFRDFGQKLSCFNNRKSDEEDLSVHGRDDVGMDYNDGVEPSTKRIRLARDEDGPSVEP